MREGYKMTELGQIPVEWSVEKFTEVTSLITCGVAARPEYVEKDGIPFLSSKNVKENRIIWEGFNCISKEKHCELTKYNKPERGDILYTRVGSFGDAAVIETDEEFSVFVSLTLIKPKHNIVNSYFLSYLLNSEFYRNLAKNSTTGLGVQNLNVSEVRKYPVVIPSLTEQEKIAEILSTIDEKIDVIDEQINQTAELKKGLTQQLLTRGIGHTQFKTSELGEIPDNWLVKKIEDFADVTAGGTPSTSIKEYWNGDIPWMNSGEINLRKIKEVEGKITEQGLKNSSTKLIPKYSVLIALAGQGKTRGKVAVNEIELCTNQSLAAIMNLRGVNHEFLFQNLESRYTELRKMSTGDVGRGGLNLSIIRSILIAIPPKAEQQKIAEMLSKVDDKICILEQKKRVYRELKKGMMQQLLTGRIRVNQTNQNYDPAKSQHIQTTVASI